MVVRFAVGWIDLDLKIVGFFKFLVNGKLKGFREIVLRGFLNGWIYFVKAFVDGRNRSN